MSTMNIEVYNAFKKAGVPDEQAVAAAKAIVDESLASKSDIQILKAEMLLLKWMVAFNLAFTMAIVYKLFFA
ncbi:integrase [Thiomicrospira microaerophila]|uniref:integrase n=1 Tax=Thiomicrospira microaerophila TaxID=406020 RepID=UPI0020108C63|nr:integrase [Thiomicrospira microaerophila]UQB42081.1 integrase [Thiomicrospira microaerophila]